MVKCALLCVGVASKEEAFGGAERACRSLCGGEGGWVSEFSLPTPTVRAWKDASTVSAGAHALREMERVFRSVS